MKWLIPEVWLFSNIDPAFMINEKPAVYFSGLFKNKTLIPFLRLKILLLLKNLKFLLWMERLFFKELNCIKLKQHLSRGQQGWNFGGAERNFLENKLREQIQEKKAVDSGTPEANNENGENSNTEEANQDEEGKPKKSFWDRLR